MAYQYGGGFAQDLNRTTVGTKLRNYGTSDVNKILREQQEDAALVERNAAVKEQERKFAFEQATRKAETDELVRRNRLGLGTLSGMLNDRYSPAYEWSEGDGQGIQMEVGGLDGSAPPEQFNNPPAVPRERILRSEYQPAFDAQAISGSRTRTVAEMAAIAQAEADARIPVIELQNKGRSDLATQNNTVKVAGQQASIQANDPTNIGKSDTIAAALPTSAGLTLARPPVEVEVAPLKLAEGEQEVKVTSSGRYIKLPDGSFVFEKKSGERTPFNPAAK